MKPSAKPSQIFVRQSRDATPIDEPTGKSRFRWRWLPKLSPPASSKGAKLYVVPWHHLNTLVEAAMRAGALQLSNPDYQHELADWTHRPPWNGDGVPLSTTVDPVPRRVPVRDFAPFGGDTMPAGIDNDQGAVYGVVYTATDDVRAWLSTGMGLSAALLTATAASLASAPISDVTEVPASRRQLHDLLPSGFAQVAVRIGHAPPGDVPITPRRLASEVVEILGRVTDSALE